MIQLLLGVNFKLGSDVRVLGAAEHLRIDYIRDDGLIFAGEIFVQKLREAITRNFDCAVRLEASHFNSSLEDRVRQQLLHFRRREAARHALLDASRLITTSRYLNSADAARVLSFGQCPALCFVKKGTEFRLNRG